jgi:hypothetical protein
MIYSGPQMGSAQIRVISANLAFYQGTWQTGVQINFV